jgi:hypothetical protein
LIKYGKPGDVIVDTATEIGADLIIVGVHKHSALKRRLLNLGEWRLPLTAPTRGGLMTPTTSDHQRVAFRFRTKVNLYNVMLMSTGLTFGTISALYGLEHNIIDQNQYSLLVTAVILSALIPTYIAQKFFYPKDEEASNFKIERKKKKIK